VALPAQLANFVFGGLSDAAATGVTDPGVSWRPVSPVSTTGYTAFTAAAWDSIGNRWLLAACDSSGTGNCEVFASQGLGDSDYKRGR